MPRVKHEWTDASQWKPGYVAENWPMFAFGSNLDPVQLMHRAPGASLVSTARINHALLWFAGSSVKRFGGVATLRETGSHEAFAMGALFKMTRGDVERMDKYEGNGRTYRRMLVTVVPPNGKPVRAFTYVHMHSDHTNRPEQSYVDTITRGYRFFGFDRNLLLAGVERSGKMRGGGTAITRSRPFIGLEDGESWDQWGEQMDRADHARSTGGAPADLHAHDAAIDRAVKAGKRAAGSVPVDMEYEPRPGGGYVAKVKYEAPKGRPRSTPPSSERMIGQDSFGRKIYADRHNRPTYAQPVSRQGDSLPGWWDTAGTNRANPESVADGYVEPHDCDCPNYRKNCRLADCPRFDNTMDDQ